MGKQTSIYKDDNKKLVNQIKRKKNYFFWKLNNQNWSVYTDYFKENNYINRGISGQTTYQMLRLEMTINLNPSAVIILAGINDLAGNNGPVTKRKLLIILNPWQKLPTLMVLKFF